MKNDKICKYRVITGKTKDGHTDSLIVWIRTQYIEELNIISLELDELEQEAATWMYPFKMTTLMVNAIEEMINEQPCMVKKLYFRAKPKRALLNARLFLKKGYNVHHQHDDLYRISRA